MHTDGVCRREVWLHFFLDGCVLTFIGVWLLTSNRKEGERANAASGQAALPPAGNLPGHPSQEALISQDSPEHADNGTTSTTTTRGIAMQTVQVDISGERERGPSSEAARGRREAELNRDGGTSRGSASPGRGCASPTAAILQNEAADELAALEQHRPSGDAMVRPAAVEVRSGSSPSSPMPSRPTPGKERLSGHSSDGTRSPTSGEGAVRERSMSGGSEVTTFLSMLGGAKGMHAFTQPDLEAEDEIIPPNPLASVLNGGELDKPLTKERAFSHGGISLGSPPSSPKAAQLDDDDTELDPAGPSVVASLSAEVHNPQRTSLASGLTAVAGKAAGALGFVEKCDPLTSKGEGGEGSSKPEEDDDPTLKI